MTGHPPDGSTVRAFAPGRVNLIGDHTDYSGGLALPMAIDLGTTVEGTPGGDRVRLESATHQPPVDLSVGVDQPGRVEPFWGRYVAGVVHQLRPATGFLGRVTTTLPVGGGLSSSAALELAVALALGFAGPPEELAALGQRAEQEASGVPCGIMDQLASACGVAGHALLIDFTTLSVEPVALPPECDVVVVDSGEPRSLAGSAYAERRAAVERAAAEIGDLRTASPADVDLLADGVLRRRARHVITENARVLEFAAALAVGDLATAGRLMVASHQSLGDNFEVSTPGLDRLVTRLTGTRGVFGARLTGAGFGGCVVALTEPGALAEGWTVRPSAAARIVTVPEPGPT